MRRVSRHLCKSHFLRCRLLVSLQNFTSNVIALMIRGQNCILCEESSLGMRNDDDKNVHSIQMHLAVVVLF